MTFIEHTKRRRRREGTTHSPVLSARGIGRRVCIPRQSSEFTCTFTFICHLGKTHKHSESIRHPCLGAQRLVVLNESREALERVVCTVNYNNANEKLYKVCANCTYMFTCTPVQFSSDFSYFKVPPRAHPSAGSPSGSAALDLT